MIILQVVVLTTFYYLYNRLKTMQTLTMPSRRITPLSVKLDAHEKEQLVEIAKEKTRSVHFVLCEAVREYMEREKARLAFKREAHDAWKHYQQTGLHVTKNDVSAWIDNLYTDKETAAPICHK